MAGKDSSRDRNTRFVESNCGILTYAQLAPQLAERVLACEEALVAGAFDNCPLDEQLLLQLHRFICADLFPEWAGRWRVVDVRVGNLCPPSSYLVPQMLRDYVGGLAARWNTLAPVAGHLALETLAFAEGRLLTIHPFFDFNGRVTRLWLREILRRARLPQVVLTVEGEESRAAYFRALEAADACDWKPLSDHWAIRFEQISPPTSREVQMDEGRVEDT